jgi:PAS domain S-box-containing protein
MHDFRELLSSVNDAVWSFDLIRKEFIYANNNFEKLYQTPLDKIDKTAAFWLKYVHPDDYDQVLFKAETAVTATPVEFEYRLLVENDIKWVCDKRVILFDENKEPKSIMGVLSDISLRKNSESHLTDTKNIYSYLFIDNPNPLWIYSKQTLRFLAVNNAAIANYGYTKDEFLSMTISDIRPEEDVPELINHVDVVKDTYSNPRRYWRHTRKNGEIAYVSISGHGIHYNGEDAEIVMAHDITFEVEGRRKVRLAKENLDALINNLEDDIWSIDRNYNLISANRSYLTTLKDALGREAIVGESVFMAEYPEDDKLLWKSYYDKALNGEAFTFTEILNLPGKTAYCIETKMNPIRDKRKIIGVACISTNIQDALDAHNRILEQNKKLREVISLASHDIRGPVATLLSLISAYNNDNPTDPFNGEVIKLIADVTINLDGVLHKLVDKSHSLREDQKAIKSPRHNQSKNE